MEKAAPKAQDADAKPYQPTPADAKALEAYRAGQAKKGPRLKVAGGSDVKVDHPDPTFGHLALLKAVGSTDSDFLYGLTDQQRRIARRQSG